ncbi:arginine--tRNA ligase, chloroplastic/mitochondrial [Tanacetum coccineum]
MSNYKGLLQKNWLQYDPVQQWYQSQGSKSWGKPVHKQTHMGLTKRYLKRETPQRTLSRNNQRKRLSPESKDMLRRKVKEIEAFNGSKVRAADKKKGDGKAITSKERRARCYICRKRGHVFWKCQNKGNTATPGNPTIENKTREPIMVEDEEEFKYPEDVHEPNRLLKWAHGKAALDKSKRFSKWVHSTSTMAAPARWSLQEEILKPFEIALEDSYPRDIYPGLKQKHRIYTYKGKHGVYECQDALWIWPGLLNCPGITVSKLDRGPRYVGEKIKKKFLKFDMIKGRPSVNKLGFVTIKLSGKWIAKSIHKMLKAGIDTWAPKLPVQMVIVDYPSLDEEMHVDLFQRSSIGCTLMSILEFSKVDVTIGHRPILPTCSERDGILAQEVLNRWFLYEERGGDVVMKGKLPFILSKTDFNTAYKDVLALWKDDKLNTVTIYQAAKLEKCEAAKLLGYTAEAVFRYTCLTNHRLAVWTFDIDEMLNEEGNTFVYLLITQAKVRRITDDSCKDINELKKASISSRFNALELILEKEEGWEKVVMEKCFHLLGITPASSFFALSMTQLPLRLPLSAPERPMDVKARNFRFEPFSFRTTPVKEGKLFGIISISNKYGLLSDGESHFFQPDFAHVPLFNHDWCNTINMIDDELVYLGNPKIDLSAFWDKKSDGECGHLSVVGENGSTDMYYMVLKDAVDTTLEVKFETNTLSREVSGYVLAYYGDDFLYECQSEDITKDYYTTLLFLADRHVLKPGKIQLIKSMLAVPTKGSLVINAYLEDARYGEVILKKSCIFKSQLRGCSYGTLSGWEDCSLHLKVDWQYQA